VQDAYRYFACRGQRRARDSRACLNSCDERYVNLAGSGLVDVGEMAQERVEQGDVVVIPAGTPQRINNDGEVALIFYCICTPRFRPELYQSLEG
jgi:mannose-6-phosphate isomerase-like protein (cupin superfamily)